MILGIICEWLGPSPLHNACDSAANHPTVVSHGHRPEKLRNDVWTTHLLVCMSVSGLRCKLEGWMFSGEKLTDVILWIIIDRSNDNGNGSRYRHADRQMSGPDIVSQYFPGCDRVTR